jgi:hypothetical protein
MHMIGHHFKSQNLAIEFCRNLPDQRLQPHLDCTAKHLATVLGAPNEVIVDQGNRSCLASVRLHHELDYSTLVLYSQYNTPLSHPSKGWDKGDSFLSRSCRVVCTRILDLEQSYFLLALPQSVNVAVG